MRLKDGLATMHGPGKQPGTSWNWFPWWIAGSMGVVIAVNIAMVTFALHTFPGQAGSDGFDLSNHYDQVLAKVQQQAALGWDVRLLPGDAGHPVLVLTDRSGAPLRDAQVQGIAARPLGPPETTPLVFRDAGPGRYVADAPLTMPGQWEMEISVAAQGHTIATTKRIVIAKPLPRAARERFPSPSASIAA